MEISQIIKEINSPCDFSFKPAFFYTEDSQQTDAMEQECKARQAIGISCELFTKEKTKMNLVLTLNQVFTLTMGLPS